MYKPVNVSGLKRDLGQAIIIKYARKTRHGKIARCVPSDAEQWNLIDRKENEGTDGKVIYPTEEIAQGAARELAALVGKPHRAYPCNRSKTGHAHITTKY